MTGNPRFAIIEDAEIGSETVIHDQVNLYGCEIGDETKVDAFVYIEESVTVGDECILRPFTFIPNGVEIGDRVFVGPNVTFTNDRYPNIGTEWELEETVVEDDVAIGAGSVICPGVRVGTRSLVGAGAVVTEDVPPETTVVGNPARPLSD